MLSMYAVSRETNELNLKTAKKNVISSLIFARLTQIWSPKIFSLILPLLNVTYCCKLSLCAISRKINDPNSRKWRKLHFGPDLGSQDQNSGRDFFFSKIWLPWSLDIMISYHHVQYQKKLMIQS